MKKELSKCSCHCSCGTNYSNKLTRRDFVRLAAAGVAVVSQSDPLAVMAGPFEDNDYLRIITQDKKLSPEWIASLYSRGQKQVYSSRQALEHIGMPVGGLFAGTVYLSGDGRLWLWDVFNRDQEGIVPKTVVFQGQKLRSRDGSRFIEPAPITTPFEQGFGLKFKLNDSVQDVPLTMDGFEKVSFNGQYIHMRL